MLWWFETLQFLAVFKACSCKFVCAHSLKKSSFRLLGMDKEDSYPSAIVLLDEKLFSLSDFDCLFRPSLHFCSRK